MISRTSTPACRAVSLGAGAQSTVSALLLSQSDPRLADLGYSRPDVAIFADTGWEPEYVYRRLGAALKEIERDGSETPSAVAAVRLLMLTGCRLSEISG